MKFKCTLLYFKWRTNKGLLWTTGDSAQGDVVAWMGGQFGGEQIHVCGQLSPVAVDLKTITTLLIGYTPIQDKIF